MESAVSSIFSACFGSIARATATPGVEQKRPMRRPGVANCALLPAIVTSHVAASWHPAAVARPGIDDVGVKCVVCVCVCVCVVE